MLILLTMLVTNCSDSIRWPPLQRCHLYALSQPETQGSCDTSFPKAHSSSGLELNLIQTNGPIDEGLLPFLSSFQGLKRLVYHHSRANPNEPRVEARIIEVLQQHSANTSEVLAIGRQRRDGGASEVEIVPGSLQCFHSLQSVALQDDMLIFDNKPQALKDVLPPSIVQVYSIGRRGLLPFLTGLDGGASGLPKLRKIRVYYAKVSDTLKAFCAKSSIELSWDSSSYPDYGPFSMDD